MNESNKLNSRQFLCVLLSFILSSRIDRFSTISVFKYPLWRMLIFLRGVVMILIIMLIFVSFPPLYIQVPQVNDSLNQKKNDNNNQ
jgi:hypothetical protein